ncbi:protein kinase [Actinoplanes sp. NBC_00393]|uniref:serine/threonine-protein kinase n=1 Tax=Actinoplanes sp. NBC_00393 TaxID=2975953 RepID=UPI002E247F1E
MRSSLSPSVSGSGLEQPATVDLSNRCVGNSYVLVCPVGQGATGTVWRGVDRSTGEPVAVKLLHEGLLRQPKLVTRFVQERTILLMVRHENIVGVRDLFSVGESIGLVMDFVAGGSLRDRLRAAGTLPPADAARLLAQVAAALTETHALGVVHRDVKPDNILLSDAGQDAEVRLTDFGIARVLDTAGLTTPHAIIGTPHYMAPETISGGEAAPSADVYALGVTLYELVCGHTPYTGEPLGVLQGHLNDVPARPAGLPDEVWSVIEECLDKDPARRPTAADLQDTLRKLARRTAGVPALPVTAGTVVTEPRGLATDLPKPAPPRPARRPHRNGPRSWFWSRHGLVIALVSGSLAAAGWGGYNAWQLRDAQRTPAPATAQVPGQNTEAKPILSTPPQPLPSAQTTPSAPPALAAAAGVGAGVDGGDVRSVAPPAAGRSGAAQVGVTAGPGRIGATVGPGQVGGTVEFGPWQCGEKYSWDLGHPVLAQACHALGPAVRVQGEMEAAPGVQADISLALHDAETDEIVAGPYRCRGLMFTDFAIKHSCGPGELKAPRGRSYVVVQKWEYTGRPLLPGGTIRGREFSW